MKKTLGIICAALIITGCQPETSSNEVNLYSARKENLIKPLLDRFSAHSGIKVNLVTGKADALLKRLTSEGKNTPADLFITVDAGRLYRAVKRGVLQPVKTPKLLAAVPDHLRNPQGLWYGLSTRARTVFYVKNKVDPAELSTYEDLADKKWRGKICIRSSGNIYNQSLVAAMIAHNGVEKTEKWAADFIKNLAVPPRGGDRDQIKSAAAGVCDIAVANTYYYGKMLTGKDEAQRLAASRVNIFWPNQNGRGVHVNVSGIGLVKYGKNKDNAIKLMEFLLTPESQKWYAEVNHEYPVRPGTELSAVLKQWGTFKADNLKLEKLGVYNEKAVKLMDRAGWQ